MYLRGAYEARRLVGGADVCVLSAYYAVHQMSAVAESEAGGSPSPRANISGSRSQQKAAVEIDTHC